MDKKKINWKKIGWIMLHLGVLLVCNTALIVFFIFQMVDVGDCSFWDAITVKFIAKEMGYMHLYHWFNKLLVFFFIGVGAILTCLYLKFLFKEKIEKRKKKEEQDKEMEKEERETKRQNAFIESQNKLIDSILKGKK